MTCKCVCLPTIISVSDECASSEVIPRMLCASAGHVVARPLPSTLRARLSRSHYTNNRITELLEIGVTISCYDHVRGTTMDGSRYNKKVGIFFNIL